MIPYVVILSQGGPEAGDPAEPPDWEKGLIEAGFQLLKARTPLQAQYYAKSHPLSGLVVLLNEGIASILESLEQITRAEPSAREHLVGLATYPLDSATQAELARAGLRLLLDADAPPGFLAHYLKTRQALLTFQALEREGMDVRTLAEQTRKMLHDTSQPLTTLQGRLQVLDFKCNADDPMKPALAELNRQILQVTDHLRHLHELHRKYS